MAHPRISYPRLDPLRALCFLAVFGSHAYHTMDPAITGHPVWQVPALHVFGPGFLGVNVFFVLSGFLITHLLIAERALNGRIDVPRFWMRRILRIWPLYFLVVGIGLVAVPMAYAALGAPRPGTADPLPFLFFYSNLTKAAGLDAGSSVLTVLWSIAVEEQFYLAWPLLLVAVPRRLAALPPALLLLASILFRIAHPDHGVRLWHSFACMGDLAMGGLAAAWLDTGRGRVAVSRWGTSTALLLHAALIGLYALAAHLRALPEGDVWHPVLFAAAAAGVVLYQTAGAAGPLQLPPAGPLAELGRISYGLYCLHMIGVLAVVQVMTMLGLGGRLWHVVLLQPVAALVLTVTLAQLSYRWLELPFLRLKDRFSYIRR